MTDAPYLHHKKEAGFAERNPLPVLTDAMKAVV